MRKRNYTAIFAAGLAGVMLLTGGCGRKDAAAETSAETTAVAEITTAAEVTTAAETGEKADETETGAGASELAAPGSVWFDQDTMTAHGDIAGASEETDAPAGEEADVQAPVKVWGSIVSVEGDEITVDNQSDASAPGEMIIHVDPEHSVVVDAVSGLPVELSGVEPGSYVAYLGPAMTMSLPPQTTAYAVIVNIPEDFKAPVFAIAEGAVVDTDNGKLLDAYGDQDYLLADDVDVQPYLTRNIVTLEDIREGSRCLIWLNEYDMVTKLVLFAD